MDEELEPMFDDLDLSRAPKKSKEDPQCNIAVVTSKKDPASMNVRQHLLKGLKEQKLKFDNNTIFNKEHVWLLTLDESMLNYEHIDEKIDAEVFIFASRHQSREEKPSLCVHAPGNFGKAEMGGSEKELCLSSAVYNKVAFQVLAEQAKKHGIGCEVTLEATHHGPLLTKRPCFFIEIGSTEKEWSDKGLGAFMAETILLIIKKIQAIELGKEKHTWKTAIAVGGPHYCPSFNKIQLESDIAIGHVCAKYNLDSLDDGILKQAVERTKEKIDLILLDGKGLGEYKDKIKKVCDDSGIEVKKVD